MKSFIYMYTVNRKWFVYPEKRTLICVDNRQSNSICQLALNSSRKSIATSCFDQKIVNNKTTTNTVRSYCRLQCANADRDSVITKIPHWRHKCIRYYTYDSERRDNEWFIWRSDSCRNESVTFEIHCGFPITWW